MARSSLTVAAAIAFGWLHVAVALDRSLYGIDYDTRTYEWGGCKSENDMRLDFQVLKPLTSNIRVYSIDDVCIERLLSVASEIDMRLWMGIWGNVNATEDDFEPEFVRLQQLVLDGRVRNDNVVGIHVASEALFRYYSRDEHDWAEEYSGVQKIFGYVEKVREFLRANDLTFPVAIADVIDSYKSVPEIYSIVDVVTVNQFSQWEGGWSNEGANLLFDRMHDIRQAARMAGKPVLLSETGWSANGTTPDIKEASPSSSGDMAYYYFTSFNLAWGSDTDSGEIERNFGLFDVDRNLLPHVKNVTLGAYHKPVRLWHDGQVIKADGHNTKTFGRVYLEPPARGLSDSLDREIWFYDRALGTFRSRSTNQCLSIMKSEDRGSTHELNVTWCQPADGGDPSILSSQRWHIRPKEAAIELFHAPSPNQDPVEADESLTCGSCRNCQFAGMYFSLCYVNWSPADCKRMGGDHHWCGNSGSTCLRTSLDGRVEAADCDAHDHSFQFHVRSLEAEELTVTSLALDLSLTTSANRAVTVAGPASDIAPPAQVWYYDPMFQRIRSKAKMTDCLDVVDSAGRVETHFCDHSPSQWWSYNDLTGQLLHMGQLGRCLEAREGKPVVVGYCDLSVPTQKWAMHLLHTSSSS
ncbi:hypothetical protein DYB32_008354 [Aphanomyces invadans]|uniref:glucan endo-1,3-beta-D-glucosidase n=1 Tax=Aphanomyces invadans TaxID=157072 RepID=A0A418ALF9_9STRA|nr:hypothetical protein DYB32_008354 [Aphanomyces invadans]